MADEYSVVIVMEIELPRLQELSSNPDPERHVQLTCEQADGTFVEVENTGDICKFNSSKAFDGLESEIGGPSGLERPTGDPDGWRPTTQCSVTLSRAGRNLVLLPVGGGNQIFDHWEGACAGQGARCELPEPPPGQVDPLAGGRALAVWAYFKAHEVLHVTTDVKPGTKAPH
jgi:hypothetical protein